MIKRLLIVALFLASACFSRERATGYCQQGGVTARTTTPNFSVSPTVQASYPSCTVTVYLTGTLTPATIYADNAGTSRGNPFTASTTGMWLFYADNGRYDVRLSGTVPTPFTLGDVLVWDPAVLSTTIAAGDSSSIVLDASKASIFEISLTADVSNFALTNASLGQLATVKACQDSTGHRSFQWDASFQTPPPVIQAASKCTSAQFYFNASNVWKLINRTDSAAEKINAKLDFGCVGDDASDDTACFQAIRNYFYAYTQTALTWPGQLMGAISVYIPCGTYKVTAAQAFMASTYSGPAIQGYNLEGGGQCTVIHYAPTISGPLFYNNNAVQGMSLKEMVFLGDDDASNFMYSYSEDKAQDYSFYNVTWYGHFAKVFELHGTNTNSEFRFIGGGSILHNNDTPVDGGASTYFIYAPDDPPVGQDQFLNYYFYGAKIWHFHGNFLLMKQGGHIKLTNCDFSGWEGSGDVNNPNIIFNLQNASHSFGVAYFISEGNRFELKTSSIRVLESDWGSYGQVSFLDTDWSSQTLNYDPSTIAFNINFKDPGGNSVLSGPFYSFERCSIIGKIKITINNFIWVGRKFITLKNVEFMAPEDWMNQFVFAGINGTTETNTGGYPWVNCENCRGGPTYIYPGAGALAQSVWAPSTVYATGYYVYSQGYTYHATTGGTSGTTPPTTRSLALTDGSVVWRTIDTYNNMDYASDVILKASSVAGPTSGTSGIKRIYLSQYNSGNRLPLNDPLLTDGPRMVRMILPPNSVVVKVAIYVQPGGNTSSANANYVFRSDAYTPTTIATFYYNNQLLTGGYNEQNVFYRTGDGVADFGTRSIVLYTNADQAALGYAYIEYF